MKLTAQRNKTVYVPNDEDGGYIVIKNLTMEEVASIESKYFLVTDVEVRMSNYAARDAQLAKSCLIDWGNLYDESGRPMKFTPKNVEKASAFVIEVDSGRKRFFEWINDERDKFAEEVDAEEKKAEKN